MPAMVGCDRLRRFGLFGNGGFGAMEFKEQGRRFAIAKLRMAIDAAHHDVVERVRSAPPE